jgi:hypothetical protein
VIASIWEPVLIGLALWTGCMVVAVLTAGLLVWRRLRRGWRGVRSHAAVVGAVTVWEATESALRRRSGPLEATDLAGWPARRVRKELWRSVDRAAAAVRVADEAGGTTAELPALSRRIRAAAADLDKVLRVDLSAPVPVVVEGQVLELMRAADDVRLAAVASAGDAGAQRVRELTVDAGRELEILDAVFVSARAAEPPQIPG